VTGRGGRGSGAKSDGSTEAETSSGVRRQTGLFAAYAQCAAARRRSSRRVLQPNSAGNGKINNETLTTKRVYVYWNVN